RADLVDILDGIHTRHPQVDLSMTTNGINLERKIDDLVSAGLSRINVSLDTVCPETFAKITRRDRLTKVLSGLHSAKAAGLSPIKLNAVLLRGINDHEATEFLLGHWSMAISYVSLNRCPWMLTIIGPEPIWSQHRRSETRFLKDTH